jgi:hypothetical protein
VVPGTKCEGAALLSFCWRGISQPLWCRAPQVRALLWPLFALTAWAQPATTVAGTSGENAALASVSLIGLGMSQPTWWLERKRRALLWPLFAWSAWAHSATVVAGRKVEGAALSPVRLVGVSSGNHCGGWHNMFAFLAWAHSVTVVAGTTGEGAELASVRLVGMSSASHCGGGTTGEGAALASVRSVVLVSASHCCGGHDR